MPSTHPQKQIPDLVPMLQVLEVTNIGLYMTSGLNNIGVI